MTTNINYDACFRNVRIRFRNDGRSLIDSFSHTISSGTILTVMGESGSGKSTLLNFITGVIDESIFHCEGDIECGGESLQSFPPERRRMGLMVQDYVLFPHLTVEQNLLFALRKKQRSSHRKDIVRSTLAEARLAPFVAKQYPHTLSGGQMARVALMRTLLSDPRLLLLDEPFSRLDKETRATIRNFVFDEVEKRKVPALLVTHDAQDIADTKAIVIL